MQTQQIIIAWAEKTALVPTGRKVMRDMNWFPEFRVDWEGKAAMWCRKGKPEDIEKAKQYAEIDNHTVFVFPASERDPLGKARDMAIKAARKSE